MFIIYLIKDKYVKNKHTKLSYSYELRGDHPPETSHCGEPAISLHSHTVSLVQWVNPFLPIIRDPGLIPRGVLM
jgi:hypothetical protein